MNINAKFILKAILKLLIFICFIVFLNLLIEYFADLHLENNRFLIPEAIARFIYGDGIWTFRKSYRRFLLAVQTILFILISKKTCDKLLLSANTYA